MEQKPPIRYSLDDDTQELLENIMTWAQDAIDIQRDDDVKADMNDMILELAERMGVQRSTIHIEETEEENGDIHLKIRVEREDDRPKLTLVEGDSKVVPFKPIDDDDDGTRH